MKKTIIILSIFATIVNGCGQQTTKTMEMPEILNECWTEERDYENSSGNKIVWYKDSTFSFTETNPESPYYDSGMGIYIYQPETKEIFAFKCGESEMLMISDGDTTYSSDKKYFLISLITDSTVVVNTVPSDFEIKWFEFDFDSQGKMQLIFTNVITNKIPFITKRYRRSKLESDKNEE